MNITAEGTTLENTRLIDAAPPRVFNASDVGSFESGPTCEYSAE